MRKDPFVALPRHWPRIVKSGLLHAVGLQRLALLEVRTGFENSPDPRAHLVSELDRMRERVELLEEELHASRTAAWRASRPPSVPTSIRPSGLRS